jgi:hypothetical protein
MLSNIREIQLLRTLKTLPSGSLMPLLHTTALCRQQCTGSGIKLNGYDLMTCSHIWACPGNKLSTSALLRLIEAFWRAYRWVLMREA